MNNQPSECSLATSSQAIFRCPWQQLKPMGEEQEILSQSLPNWLLSALTSTLNYQQILTRIDILMTLT
jgi:hypothetical protein